MQSFSLIAGFFIKSIKNVNFVNFTFKACFKMLSFVTGKAVPFSWNPEILYAYFNDCKMWCLTWTRLYNCEKGNIDQCKLLSYWSLKLIQLSLQWPCLRRHDIIKDSIKLVLWLGLSNIHVPKLICSKYFCLTNVWIYWGPNLWSTTVNSGTRCITKWNLEDIHVKA